MSDLSAEKVVAELLAWSPKNVTTRERKERFLRSFDANKSPLRTAITAISERIYLHGLDWLTDEQLAEITSDVVVNAMSGNRRMVRDRAILRRGL
jgi:signal transduction histidine kinase